MKFHFHPQAEVELDDAVAYYDACEAGLGLEFAEGVYSTIGRIVEYPDASPFISMNTRRCLVSRFPYGVVFQVKSGAIRIIAVASLHRRPRYWQGRI